MGLPTPAKYRRGMCSPVLGRGFTGVGGDIFGSWTPTAQITCDRQGSPYLRLEGTIERDASPTPRPPNKGAKMVVVGAPPPSPYWGAQMGTRPTPKTPPTPTMGTAEKQVLLVGRIAESLEAEGGWGCRGNPALPRWGAAAYGPGTMWARSVRMDGRVVTEASSAADSTLLLRIQGGGGFRPGTISQGIISPGEKFATLEIPKAPSKHVSRKMSLNFRKKNLSLGLYMPLEDIDVRCGHYSSGTCT